MSRDFDVLIIGGGPAGSACAIQLARGGARVAIIEASDFSRFRIGEIVDPSVRFLLQQLGIDTELNLDWAAPCTGVRAAWGQPTTVQRSSILNPFGRGWRVERQGFDCMLFEQARSAGAVPFAHCRLKSAERQDGSWTFMVESPRGNERGRAAWIVAATGRTPLAPAAPDRTRLWLDRLVGIASIEDVVEHQQSSAPTAALVEATKFGWWYSVTLSNGRRLMVFFTDADLLPSGRRNVENFLRDQLNHSPFTCAGRQFVEYDNRPQAWSGFDARSSIRRIVVSEGWVAIGDAAMAFDPLCGRGLVEALTSGMSVADWLIKSCPVQDDGVPAWVGQAADRFNVYCAQRVSTYGIETRWADSPFWQRRQPGSEKHRNDRHV